jgi:hypothetical protein
MSSSANSSDIARLELIERPERVTKPVYHATPERLVETIFSTYENGKAVKFMSDEATVRGIYNKVNAMARTRGRRLKMQSLRPRDHNHRVRTAPYDVIMWIEDRT